MRSKVSFTDSEADILAREQSKNKLLALCLENGKKFKYDSPVSSQDDVHKMYNKIQKLNEQDQLAIMRREVKLKKAIFSDLPSDFVLFKQLNISAKKMYQNLLSLHAVDANNQESISVEEIYEITDSLTTLSLAGHTKRSRASSQSTTTPETMADLQWPPQEDEFVITLEEDGWKLGSVQSYSEKNDTILVQSLESLKTRAKDDKGKTYWIYATEEDTDFYERKNVVETRPSVSMAKNIKRKDPVFALLNREIIEAMTNELFGTD